VSIFSAKKPGIADVVQKLKTRARSAKPEVVQQRRRSQLSDSSSSATTTPSPPPKKAPKKALPKPKKVPKAAAAAPTIKQSPVRAQSPPKTPSALKRLLEANPKQLHAYGDKEGNTIVHQFVAHAMESLHTVVANARQKSVAGYLQEMLDTGAADESLQHQSALKEMAAASNKSGLRPLHAFLTLYSGQYSAEQTERLFEMLTILVEKLESDINAPVVSVNSAADLEFVVHMTARCRTPEFVRLVLSHFPLLDQLDGQQRTALAVAVAEGNTEAARQLVKAGADCKYRFEKEANLSLLAWEALNNKRSFDLIPLLVEKGADIKETVDESRNTALHLVASRASQKGALEALNALINAGADVNAVNKNGLQTVYEFEFF
jgi:hypothetical protein